jgi:hypothetical protein
VGFWKGLRSLAGELDAIGATAYGVSAEAPPQLRAFRLAHELPFTMLSDPHLRVAEVLDSPTSTAKGYYSAMLLHPEIRHYPRKAFLQPALFIWRRATLVYEWRQTEKLRNLFGAAGRPDGAEVLRLARSLIADR